MKNFKAITYFAIIGFVIGSVTILIPTVSCSKDMIQGIVAGIVGFLVSYAISYSAK